MVTGSLLRKGHLTQDQEGYARLSSCPVQPKPRRDILYAAAASIDASSCANRAVRAKPTGYKPKHPSFVAVMAAPSPTANIQVDTRYLSVDARSKPLKQVQDKYALEFLYHGGLAAERLGLDLGSEGDEFYAGIQREYVEIEVEPDAEEKAPMGEVAQPATPPSTHMTVEDAVANRSEAANPFTTQGPAAYPCPACQAEPNMARRRNPVR